MPHNFWHITFSDILHLLCESAFFSNSSKYHKSPTVRARELKFRENVHPPQHVTCHVSYVMCQMSHITCHVSRATFFLTKLWSLLVEGLLLTGTTPSSLYVEEVSQKKILISYNIFFCGTSSTSVAEEEAPATEEDTLTHMGMGKGLFINDDTHFWVLYLHPPPSWSSWTYCYIFSQHTFNEK